jgi:hypothetical protein
MRKRMMNLALKVIFLHAIKSYNMGPPALLTPIRKACCGFLSPLKIHCLGWL